MKRGTLTAVVLSLLLLAGWFAWTRFTTLVAFVVPSQLVGATVVIDGKRLERLSTGHDEFYVSRGPHRFEIQSAEWQTLVIEVNTTGQSEVYFDIPVEDLKRNSPSQRAT